MGRCRTVLMSPCLPVLVAYFLSSMGFTGTIAVVGILFNDMSISLNTSVTEFGLSTGVFTMCCSFPAPFIVIAYRRLKCPHRVPMLVGSVMASLGLILVSFATSTWHVTLCLAMTAIGLCIQDAYLVMTLMRELTDNFNFLFCLASSGTAVGMVLPPLVAELLCTAYGWRGTLLIIGALMANTIPSVLCIQCIRSRNNRADHIGDKVNRTRLTHSNDRGNDDSNNTEVGGGDLNAELPSTNHVDGVPHNALKGSLTGSLKYMGDVSLEAECSDHDETTRQLTSGNEDGYSTVKDVVRSHYACHDVIGESEGSCEGGRCRKPGNHHLAVRYGYCGDTSTENISNSPYEEEFVSFLSRKDLTQNQMSCSIKGNSELPSGIRTAKMDEKGCDDLRRFDNEEDGGVNDHRRSAQFSTRRSTSPYEKEKNRCVPTFWGNVFDSIRFTPFYTDPWGDFVYISYTMFGIVYSGWHAFLVPHALERGISPYYVLIITTLAAVGNFTGRVSAGVLTNSLVSPASLFLMLCPVNSLLLLGYAYVSNEIGMTLMSCVSAATLTGRAKLPVLIGKGRTSADKYHFVFGACQLSLGIGMLLGGLLSGVVVDQLSSYDAAFKLLAAVEVGVFFLMLPLRLR